MKNERKRYLAMTFLVIIILVITAFYFLQQENKSSERHFAKGVTLSPKSFQSLDFIAFFENAGQTGDIISWAGDWYELGNMLNGGPKVLSDLSKTYDYVPLIEAQFFQQSDGHLLRPIDNLTKLNYIDVAVKYANEYKPNYLAFGIEVNALYEKSPDDFGEFVKLFSEVYDAIKLKSQDTKVFTIFQLEKARAQ